MTTPVAKARLERQLPAGRRRNLRRHQPARLLLPVSVRQQHALHDPDDRRPAQELDAAHGTELPCQRRRSLGGGGFGCDTFYGVNYDVYVGNPDGQRVQNITYADGTPVKDDDTIYACLSSYRLSATRTPTPMAGLPPPASPPAATRFCGMPPSPSASTTSAAPCPSSLANTSRK